MIPNDNDRSIAIANTTIRLSLTDNVLLIVLGHFHISRREDTKKQAKDQEKNDFFSQLLTPSLLNSFY
jgi:hypothetical protein